MLYFPGGVDLKNLVETLTLIARKEFGSPKPSGRRNRRRRRRNYRGQHGGLHGQSSHGQHMSAGQPSQLYHRSNSGSQPEDPATGWGLPPPYTPFGPGAEPERDQNSQAGRQEVSRGHQPQRGQQSSRDQPSSRGRSASSQGQQRGKGGPGREDDDLCEDEEATAGDQSLKVSEHKLQTLIRSFLLDQKIAVGQKIDQAQMTKLVEKMRRDISVIEIAETESDDDDEDGDRAEHRSYLRSSPRLLPNR